MNNEIWNFIVGAITAAWLTWLVTFNVMEANWKEEAIENNCAHYNGKTAKFTWGKSNSDK